MLQKNIIKSIDPGRIKNFPISFLAVTLGLSGFSLAWQRAEQILKLPFSVHSILLFTTLAVTLFVFVMYLLKLVRYPAEVKAEFYHPIKINFYPIIAKLFLIISIILLHSQPMVSRYLWWGGVAVQSFFTVLIMGFWIRHDKFEIHHINPSWFIPVVGSILIPIAGVEHFHADLSVFFFSIGIFWWIILTTLVINRVVFHHPIADKLVPTFFILFAPPVIGFIALTKINGSLTLFGNMLYYIGVFLFLLIIFQFRMFSRLTFYLSWWAYSFPMSALTIGTLLMYHETGYSSYLVASWLLFITLNILILVLTVKTLHAISKRKICIEEID
ncbi:MAG: SLAC1 anion channel family protein [Spirochaetes bacterium]|nr:SLAC1 anion channel family protein [Spirochaetota bacterium]MBN2772142.1 SLAC1 anion channel family protein [Spirochaetota bacterium]